MEIGGRKISVARKAPEQEELSDNRPSNLWGVIQLVSWQMRDGTGWHAHVHVHVQFAVLVAHSASAQSMVVAMGAMIATIMKTTVSALMSDFIYDKIHNLPDEVNFADGIKKIIIPNSSLHLKKQWNQVL